ncbi:recombinase family protein [Cellulosimicrobium funkei]|uniref:recombinase family protein n=1 Tax=Cellulosimicrobium funkei TaxID=264251 RepID=UPI00343E8A49
MRVLGVTRLSRTDDAATSLPRQREAVETWCRANGHELVGLTVDEDVSGDMAPWKRPELAQWLPDALGHRDASSDAQRASEGRSRAHEWDALCVTHLDRLSRRAADLMAVMDWCKATGRRVFDTAGTEYTGPAGAVLLGVLGGLAQGERERMVERALASYKTLAASGRWRGGVAPYGYRPYTAEDGHKYLGPDPDAVAIVREAHQRILAGESVNSICADLNARAVPTPTGKPGAAWRVGNLSRVVTSQRLLGLMVEDRYDKDTGARVERPVRGPDGAYVQRAEPVVTRAELEQVREVLRSRKTGGRQKGTRANGTLLLQVLLCGTCARPMYAAYGRERRRYYRCSSKTVAGKSCGGASVPAEEAEKLIVEFMLKNFGHVEVMTRTWDPGENHDDEIAGITSALADLRADRAAGLYKGDRGAEEFRTAYAALEARREALEAIPGRTAGWVLEPTGQTWAQQWEAASTTSKRNRLLRDAEMQWIAYPDGLLPITRDSDGKWTTVVQVDSWDVPGAMTREEAGEVIRGLSRAVRDRIAQDPPNN